jgi:serine/threonine-protein kinase
LLAERGPLPVARTLEIGIALSDALTHAHRRGIVHRDLKPTNVLLAEDGTVRLTDFGVAHIAGCVKLTKTGMRLGTINYYSPEACNGEKLDERADIWGLGVMLYEMLAGERPFTGETVGETLTAVLTRPVPDLPLHCVEVSHTLFNLIYNMLEKTRSHRIPNMPLVRASLKLEARLYERGDIYGDSFLP